MAKLSKRSDLLKRSPLHSFFNKGKILISEGKDVISLGVGEPYQETERKVREAGIEAITSGNTRYTPVKGDENLRKAVQETLRREGLKYELDEIIISAGAKPVIGAAVMVLSDLGGPVFLPAPYYPPFYEVIKFSGGNPILIDTSKDDFQLTAFSFERTLSPSLDSGLLILNTPNNPTGINYSEDELRVIAELVEKRNIWVVADESYYEFIYNGKKFKPFASLPGMKERTIIVRAFSKGYAMTGWRIGYAVGPKEVMDKITLYFENFFGCASAISQEAAVTALSNRKIPKKMAEEFADNKVVMSNWLKSKGIPFVEPDGAFYFFPDFSKVISNLGIQNAEALAEYILDKVFVAVTPGSAFGDSYGNYLRLSYSVETIRLELALSRLDLLF